MGQRDLARFLGELVSSGAVTAAAAAVGDARAIAYESAAGVKNRSGAGRVTTSSLFDLASLTKPVVATLALTLDAEGELPLRQSVFRALSQIGQTAQLVVAPGLARKSLGSLLRHRSGLQPWTPLFARCEDREKVVPLLTSETGLLGAAPSTYSDLGYILWGSIVDRLLGEPLTVLIRERVSFPLGIRRLSGPPWDSKSAVECVLGNRRERELAASQGFEIGVRRPPSIGTIQDGNARFIGPSGHAGLFGSARALWRLAAEWVRPQRVLTEAATAAALSGRGGYALGWRRRPPETRGRTGLWYGHTGFTGGGVWFCPESAEVRVLLAHRSSVAADLDSWRKRFIELAI